MAAQLQIPSIAPFSPTGEPTSIAERWDKWKKSIEYFILASGIKKEERKKAFLLYLIGPETQNIFETMVKCSLREISIWRNQTAKNGKNCATRNKITTTIKTLSLWYSSFRTHQRSSNCHVPFIKIVKKNSWLKLLLILTDWFKSANLIKVLCIKINKSMTKIRKMTSMRDTLTMSNTAKQQKQSAEPTW